VLAVALVAKAGVDLVRFGRSSGYWSADCNPLNDSGVGDVNVGDGDCCALVVVSMNMRLGRGDLSHGASGKKNVDRGGLHLGQQERFV